VTPMQSKIAEIKGSVNLEEIAQQAVDQLTAEIAEHADLIAIARCEEKGVEHYDSHDAAKIYQAAEAMIINSILRHMTDIVNKGRQA